MLWVGYSVDTLKNKIPRFPKEGILPPEHKIETLPEFPACCPEDFRLNTVASILSAGEKALQQTREVHFQKIKSG